MNKRRIEIFTAGCELCEEVVAQVRDAACDSCAVEVRSTREREHAAAARRLGIRRLPAVVVDGRVADCCSGAIDFDELRALGLGAPRGLRGAS